MVDAMMGRLSNYFANSYYYPQTKLDHESFMKFIITSRAAFKAQYRREPTLMYLNVDTLSSVLAWTMGDRAESASPDVKYTLGATEVRCDADVDPHYLYLAAPKTYPGESAGIASLPMGTGLTRADKINQRVNAETEKAVQRKADGLRDIGVIEGYLMSKISMTNSAVEKHVYAAMLRDIRREMSLRNNHPDIHPVHRQKVGRLDKVESVVYSPESGGASQP